MIQKILSDDIFCGDYGWHTGRFLFFADYEDITNTHFGVLKAFNDFTLQPGSGFTEHSHENMEIISYCVMGELTHMDNMGNTTILKRGDAQYLRAGGRISLSR